MQFNSPFFVQATSRIQRHKKE